MCSGSDYGEGKSFFKEDIIYENQRISVCFDRKILGYWSFNTTYLIFIYFILFLSYSLIKKKTEISEDKDA